jgi:hypothetical protein
MSKKSLKAVEEQAEGTGVDAPEATEGVTVPEMPEVRSRDEIFNGIVVESY